MTKKLKNLKEKKRADNKKRKGYILYSIDFMNIQSYIHLQTIIFIRNDKAQTSNSKQLKLSNVERAKPPTGESVSLEADVKPTIVSTTVMKGSQVGEEE